MSIALVVTQGFGNGTFNGTIKDIVTFGYTIGAVIDTPDCFTNIDAPINDEAINVSAKIDHNGLDIDAPIVEDLNIDAAIDDGAVNVRAKIDHNGIDVDAPLCT